jgi:long-chain acyl-CoA synthetase
MIASPRPVVHAAATTALASSPTPMAASRPMNLFSLLDAATVRFPGRGAVFAGDREVLSYAALRRRALALAAHLRHRFETGDRVAIASENRPEYVELLFGIWAAGMVAVPINAKLHPREIGQIIDDCAAAGIFASASLAGELIRDGSAHPGSCPMTVIDGADYVQASNGPVAEAASVPADALAWLFYTSGTTGRSKGAMLTHRNLLAMTVGYLADVDAIDEDTSLLHGAPMSHGSGLYIPPYVARAARHVVPLSSGFDPREFLDLCDRHPGASAFLAPTMVQRLRAEAEQRGRRPANLRTIVYGGGPMYVEELKKALAVFGQVFVQIYGQGEAPMTITCLRRRDHACGDDAILGSVGWARTGVEVAIVDAHGRPVPTDGIGEIVCRGDVVMAGYWNNADATAEALRDGWLYTGDIGSIDARGYLTLRDRSKDVVISGGSNIYPREVEEVLLTCRHVAEACVVGQRDDEWGEIVVAFVVPTAGSSLTKDALDAHCLARIARFKRPKRYLFVDSLPKNSYGKVLKRELRRRLAGDDPAAQA